MERDNRLPTLLLLAITLGAWWAVPWGRFQYDDFSTILHDPATSDLGALLSRLVTGVRPLTRLSFFADAALFGMRPAGFLATNLALHLASVLLVHRLALARLADARAAFVAAAAFALEPAHAETVAYASGRSTGLMACLLLAGLLLHERGRPRAALALFAGACLAKEVALVFPLLVLAWSGRRSLRPHLALAALLAGLLALLPRYRELAGYSLALRAPHANVLAAGRAVPLTLSLLARPWALSVDHAFDPSDHVALSLAGLALLASVAALAFSLRRASPLLSLALAWPLLTLLPTHSLLAKIDLVTEKPLYLAWVGPSMLVGWGAAWLADRGPLGARAAAVVTMLFLGTGWGWCVYRASLWRDAERLWLDATVKAPDSSRSWNNLGMAWLEEGRYPESGGAFRRSLTLDPANGFAARNLRELELLCGRACEGGSMTLGLPAAPGSH